MRLFISYSHQDVLAAARVVKLLREANHDVWFDERLVAGQNWKDALKVNILAADTLVFMISPNSLASEWCQWELKQAVEAGKSIVPVLLEKITVPEPLASLQYVDVTGRISTEDVAKLIGGLQTIAEKIALNKAPIAPDEPDGLPSRASEISQQISEVSGGLVVGQVNAESFIGQQTNIERVVNAQKYVENEVLERSRTWSVPVVLGLIVGIFAVIVAVVQVFPEVRRTEILYSLGMVAASSTPTATPTALPTATITPTATPERMAANQFNVVIAGFGYQEGDAVVTSGQVADDMSDIVFDTMRQLPQIDNILGWRSNGVGRILGNDPVERERQAAEIADTLGADVVIYGMVTSDEIFNTLQPEFYVSARFASVEPELIGGDAFGEPVDFIGQSDDQVNASTSLQRRLRVLRLFLRGLALYIEGSFTDSRTSFEEAVQVESEGLEVLYVFAGNAAMREPNSDTAMLAYSAALEQRPTYARALIGRGIALHRMAMETTGDTPPSYNPQLTLNLNQDCANTDVPLPTLPQLLADLAIRCYEQAAQSSDQPTTADIDVKTAFGLGQVRVWQSTVGYGDHWDAARDFLQAVINAYVVSSPERQVRIRAATAHANAWLGLRLISTNGTNVSAVEEAVAYYRTAVALLRADINRTYNQTWIDLYIRQFEALEAWLTDQ